MDSHDAYRWKDDKPPTWKQRVLLTILVLAISVGAVALYFWL